MLVLPVETTDIPAMIRVEFAAYAGEPLAQILRGRDQRCATHAANATAKYTEMMAHEREVQHFRKVVDCHEQILGWMRWEEFRTGRPCTSANASSRSTSTHAVAGIAERPERDMIAAYLARIAEQHDRCMPAGMPHLHLALLVVDPRHQRRGVGTRLLQALLQRADALALPAYLVSSPEAQKLYEAHGFVVRDELRFCAREFGREMERVQMCMVRPAAS